MENSLFELYKLIVKVFILCCHRCSQIQGAIMVSALVQVVIGFSGLMGLIIKFIGPLTIVPTIALVGLPLFETAYFFASM